jgi:hypothetical protein
LCHLVLLNWVENPFTATTMTGEHLSLIFSCFVQELLPHGHGN